MDDKDEMRRAIIQEFAPRKEADEPRKFVPSKVQDKKVDSSSIKEEKEATNLGLSAIEQVMKKHEELDEIAKEEKDAARKPILESANTKLMKDMMKYLR